MPLVGDWLLKEFMPFGIHSDLQNWMLVAAAIVLVAILWAWRTG